jgi:serine protease Do
MLDAEEPSRGVMPEISVDRSALDRSARPAVTSYADALEEVRDAVVSVHSSKNAPSRSAGFALDDPFFRRFFGLEGDVPGQVERGLGSGVIVSPDGYVLTNNHVIEGADEVSVSLAGGRELAARIVGTDPRTDVAVLKVEGQGLAHATLGDSDQLRVGDVVFAVGNPLGVGQTTTMGIISATGRSNLRLIEQGYESFIQTDASINPGNSGGALVDAQGRVIGINTVIISTSRGNIGIGFAIPVNLAENIMRSLIETGAVARGFLGVDTQDLDDALAEAFGVDSRIGVVVREVLPEGPAARDGIRQGDIITDIDGRPTRDVAQFRLTISQTAPGSTVKVGLLRDRAAMTIDVVLGRLTERIDFSGRAANQLVAGVRVSALSPELRQQFGIAADLRGVVVVEADEQTRHGAQLPVGTVIEQINRKNVADVSGARAALVPGRNIFLVNLRGTYRYVPVDVE